MSGAVGTSGGCARSRRQQGFSLIELMVALLLGLLVVGAAIGIFLSNRQAYTATEGLGRIQENMRFAFELMARDIREAGGNPCGAHVPLVNVVTGSAGNWFSDLNSQEVGGELVNPWRAAMTGFEDGGPPSGATPGQRVPGSQALRLLSADDTVQTVASHAPAATTFTMNTAVTGIEAGNLVVACDLRQASMFRVSGVAGNTIVHAMAGGNCTGNLGLPPPIGGVCTGVMPYQFRPNAMIARLNASQWYVGNNDRGGLSLYQGRLDADGGGVTNQEVVEGVEQVMFEYLLEGANAYALPAGVPAASWADVIAVRITATLESEGRSGSTDANPLSRTITHVVNLRNRTP